MKRMKTPPETAYTTMNWFNGSSPKGSSSSAGVVGIDVVVRIGSLVASFLIGLIVGAPEVSVMAKNTTRMRTSPLVDILDKNGESKGGSSPQ